MSGYIALPSLSRGLPGDRKPLTVRSGQWDGVMGWLDGWGFHGGRIFSCLFSGGSLSFTLLLKRRSEKSMKEFEHVNWVCGEDVENLLKAALRLGSNVSSFE